MAKSFKYSVNLLRFNPMLLEEPLGCKMVFPSLVWWQMDQICFLAHRWGREGIHLVKVNLGDISGHYPVYHVEWRTNKATFETDVERLITPDILIQNLSAVRLPE